MNQTVRLPDRYSIVFLLLFPIASFAQFEISGRVLNKADAKPVAYTSIFLSNATIGDKTPADGTFRLHAENPFWSWPVFGWQPGMYLYKPLAFSRPKQFYKPGYNVNDTTKHLPG